MIALLTASLIVNTLSIDWVNFLVDFLVIAFLTVTVRDCLASGEHVSQRSLTMHTYVHSINSYEVSPVQRRLISEYGPVRTPNHATD